ncbi:hypothetical protein [Thermosulfurimonas dismutans]|uniref:Vitamin K epoxide reductase domain-containing protein n=1 Tax=Thermosulfurimonas dismutans TaxID=999894 RepID=A0A179D469_9BACT|nr:hypothetical protein [Thermosulfurimonas dismutans]OAQ20870.1 hypothetical protein TDIS_0996 [Thermosulfurimonas dismutans]
MKFSVVWALLFALGLSVEALLNFKGRAFCELSSCFIVGELARLSHRSMVLLGLGYFAVFSVLLILVLRGQRLGGLLLLLASSGLAAETIFLLRQAFDYHLWCPFCLAVALGVVGSALPVLWHFKYPVVGFLGALLGIVVAFYLTSISLIPLEEVAFSAFPERPSSSGLILIYSPECPHCHEVLEFCKKIPEANLSLCPREKALGLLRSLDLKGVPVLVIKEPPRVRILQGSGAIIAYLRERFPRPVKAPGPIPPGATEMPGLLIPETGGVCSELQPKCN